jgi:pimeloyl-ACP methyl ester carboxylesterase
MNIGVNGIDLFYEKSGQGKPLILLHGNGEDHHIFDAVAEKLRHEYTLYAIDSRNHGQSAKTKEYSYDAMAEDIYCFIRELHLGKTNIIGFSDGAIIGLMLAMKHNEVVDKMALLGVNLKPDDFTEESRQFINDTYEATKDPLFRLMLEQPDIELDDVRDIKTPVLLIAAENDIYKPELYERLVEALPHAKLMLMQGHEHGSYIVNQDILYPDFRRFFE